jgi:hypothetical protein
MTNALNALMQLFGTQQQPKNVLGAGMAQQAAQVIQSRPYQLHLQEMRALGQEPLTPEQFAQQAR